VDNVADNARTDKSAGEVIIGGLRCTVCACLFRPSASTRNELCRACHLQLAFNERYAASDRRFSRAPR